MIDKIIIKYIIYQLFVKVVSQVINWLNIAYALKYFVEIYAINKPVFKKMDYHNALNVELN